ncbi:MAG: iron-sulfur cluster repair di-iron protein [Melioribacteraceae bacterium]|nr:iron-sulfur cluster repair di-iron protein [Melioribacteraceae bacterium]MCF8262975.1 iron-sulfur cluster repair di-iron protein [Melioribacteraceae bacterium]MCF8430592.1 iron-sulfur cluster repair di-iron protein [Melioribacteraceae bacterium]
MFLNEVRQPNNSVIIKDIIKKEIKTAHVFEKYGIDFCCGGNRLLEEVCAEKNLVVENILSELDKVLQAPTEKKQRFDSWELPFLMEYIINNHHAYVKEAIPLIQEHSTKVANKHGKNYPFMIEVKSLFDRVAKEMHEHMEKEEKIVFHIIKYLDDCRKFNETPKTGGFKTVKSPIQKMENEHSSAGNAMEQIKKLTNNFLPPEGACNTFRLTYSELEEFEKDLHIHVHLENNILFPKAIKLEEDLLRN